MASVDSVGQTSAAADPTSASGAASSPKTQQNEFLQLLVAQLQTQNPLDPMDGTQFVSQLAQFSSLQELTGMHTDLNNIQATLQAANTGAATSSSSTSSGSSNPSNPFQLV